MSTRYEFSKDAIQNFSTQYEITINLTAEQTGNLADFGKTALLVEQITEILDEMCPDVNSLKNYQSINDKTSFRNCSVLKNYTQFLFRSMS